MIHIEHLCKRFGDVTAVADVSFHVAEGQICVLLGPSGCGKTTTLKMINRLVEPTSGTVRINGRDTATLDSAALRRSIGYVIQQVGLFPNMTVEENIGVVPKLLGWDAAKRRRRAAELLDIVALEPAQFLKRYPRELSGGQQQRVGVARALAADPPVMLMDEPFGAIDPINRDAIQDEFLRIQRKVNKTVLFVSHDIDEAIKMADCVALFRAGRIEQFGTPDELLAQPATEFVADFMGQDRILKRLLLMQAADIVRPDTAPADATPSLRIRADDNLRNVLSALLAHGVDSAVCVDAGDHALGVVRQADILAKLAGRS